MTYTIPAMADRYRLTTEDSKKGGRAGAQSLWKKYKDWKATSEATPGQGDDVCLETAVLPSPDTQAHLTKPDPCQAMAMALPPGVWHPDGRVMRDVATPASQAVPPTTAEE